MFHEHGIIAIGTIAHLKSSGMLPGRDDCKG